MSERFTLDSDSFERLLAAAWVLQCERNRQLHQRLLETIVEGRREFLDNASQPAAPANVVQAPDPGHPEPDPPKPPRIPPQSIASPIYSASDVEGTLALARDPGPVPGQTPRISLVPNTAAKLSRPGGPPTLPPGECPIPVSDPQENSARALALRVHILRPGISRRALQSALAPAAILLVIFAFLVSLMLNSEPPRHSSDPLTGGAQMSNASIHREPVKSDPRRAALQLRASHLRITDPAAASAVRELSRFEIRGLQRQAKYGDDSAALTLGMAYEIGRYLPQSCAQAANWVRIAAESGNPAAQYNLALRYRDGDGVSANPEESAKWLALASAHGYRQTEFSVEEQ
jgi:hypothetical protein